MIELAENCAVEDVSIKWNNGKQSSVVTESIQISCQRYLVCYKLKQIDSRVLQII